MPSVSICLLYTSYGNGKQKDYGVIGEAMMPYSLDYPYVDSVYITVIDVYKRQALYYLMRMAEAILYMEMMKSGLQN